MPAKPPFTDAQYRILLDTAKRVRRNFKSQEDMALAIGIAQPSLSALLKGKWKPGVKNAKHIAQLDQRTLEDLIGPYADVEPPARRQKGASKMGEQAMFPNLEVCIQFHSGKKSWSAWTLAAARAGYWGSQDIPAPDWEAKLDALEKTLDRGRKAS